jgi:hypothetical protein
MGTGYVTAIGAQVGQSTPGTQMLYGMGAKTSPRKRRKTAKRKVATARTRVRRAKRGKARLVKGSRAAKAYMAKIRRKRRK